LLFSTTAIRSEFLLSAGVRGAVDAADGLDEGALEALRWRPQTHLPSGLTASEADGGSTEADIPLRPDGSQLHVAPVDQRKAAREEARRVMPGPAPPVQ
jgi:hypothetical protein